MAEITNSSSITNEPLSAGVLVLGYVGLLVSCLSFGTMFTPLRQKNTKDGFFVQWVQCSVVSLVGFFINVIRGFPPFQWIAAISGLLYATGNVFSVPAVNGLGMGIAFLIWGSLQASHPLKKPLFCIATASYDIPCMKSIIVGWSVSRFGLYGLLESTEVKHSVLNYIGVIITLISGVLFIFVKQTNERSVADGDDVDETAQELTIKDECRGEHVVLNTTSDSNTSQTTENRNLFRKKLPLLGTAVMGEILRKKFRYLLMTMGLATLHGLMMTPIEKLKQRHPSGDLYQALDYVWSFYSSVFVASTIYFFLYCVIRRKEAYVNSDLVLPSVGYGVLWTTGMTMWMLSSGVLLQVIAYPIVTRVCIRKLCCIN
uniref:UNC93-like protein n=1 Tax=Angiostrongylus cantonensis TaxID=6313 RepID=A0A158P7F8_ANGCA